MIWNIAIAVGAALAQFINAWLGWRVTISSTPLTKRKRMWYEILFVCCGVIGISLIGLATYRASLERAHLWVSRVWPTYQPAPFRPGLGFDLPSALVVDSRLAVNLDVKNVGKSPAINIQDWSHAYIRGDESLTTQEEVVESFQKWIATNSSMGGTTLPFGEFFWLTASGEILSPEDRQNILSGRRIVYVLASVQFSDDFGRHEFHFCQWLQRPQGQGGTIVMPMDFCSLYNGER